MITPGTIDRIFETAHIEEVVHDFVPLKKSGANFKGLSPWTNEKTPSFFVSPSKGIFKDFSSGKGGNVVSFLMELENMSYPEALRYLADKYGIEIEETGVSDEAKEERSLRESLALINKFALERFEEALWESEEGKSIGLSYFRERGYNDGTIRKFALGYAFDKNDSFLKTAEAAGYNIEHLQKLGLVKEGNYGPYDFFRGRVIFPIRNVSGRCIAFAGRTLKSDNKVKYINSPESELYDKSRTLYGLFEAKQGILREDLCFLVEGYTDVISLHQAGVENAVASAGTSLTPEQAKLIKRYSKNVSILYDGDTAGINAAMRGIDLLLEQGLNVRVVLFPEGHDPDSFSRAVSQSELEKYLKTESKDFTHFMLDILLEGAENDPIKKSQATQRVLESLSMIGDHITRSLYIEQCSKRLGIPDKALVNELNKILRRKQLKRSSREPEPFPDTHESRASLYQEDKLAIESPEVHEKEITRVMLKFGAQELVLDVEPPEVEPENETGKEDVEDFDTAPANKKEQVRVQVAEYILHDLDADRIEFRSPVYSKILNVFRQYFEDSGSFPDAQVFTRDAELSGAIADMITSPYELSERWETSHRIYTETEDQHLKQTVFDPLMRFKLSKVKEMIRKNEEELKSVETEEALEILMQEKVALNHMKSRLCDFFGTAII